MHRLRQWLHPTTEHPAYAWPLLPTEHNPTHPLARLRQWPFNVNDPVARIWEATTDAAVVALSMTTTRWREIQTSTPAAH
eukprot:10092980-Lingulodinium_polyedra.AAC.1